MLFHELTLDNFKGISRQIGIINYLKNEGESDAADLLDEEICRYVRDNYNSVSVRLKNASVDDAFCMVVYLVNLYDDSRIKSFERIIYHIKNHKHGKSKVQEEEATKELLNILLTRTCKKIQMMEVMLKAKVIPKKHKIPFIKRYIKNPRDRVFLIKKYAFDEIPYDHSIRLKFDLWRIHTND